MTEKHDKWSSDWLTQADKKIVDRCLEIVGQFADGDTGSTLSDSLKAVQLVKAWREAFFGTRHSRKLEDYMRKVIQKMGEGEEWRGE